MTSMTKLLAMTPPTKLMPVTVRYSYRVGCWIAECRRFVCAGPRRIDAVARLCAALGCTADALEIVEVETFRDGIGRPIQSERGTH